MIWKRARILAVCVMLVTPVALTVVPSCSALFPHDAASSASGGSGHAGSGFTGDDSAEGALFVGPTMVELQGLGLKPDQLQSGLMSYADRFWSVVSQAMDEVRRGASTDQQRMLAMTLKINMVESALRIAADPNPLVAMVDMTVMVTLTHQVWDEHTAASAFNLPADNVVSNALATMDEEAWGELAKVLSPAELEGVRGVVAQTRAAFPDQIYFTNFRASAFATQRRDSVAEAPGGTSLLQILALDPLATLSPATREIQEARLLAERMFFYGSRMPTLLSWRSDRAMMFAATLPQTEATIDSFDRIASVGATAAELFAEMPDRIAEEREATIVQLAESVAAERREAIDQAFDRLKVEREAIVSDLDTHSTRLRELIDEYHAAIDASTRLNESVRGTLTDVGELNARLNPPGEPADPDAHPFDIREYRGAAESATATAKELNTLVASVQTLLESPKWDQRSTEGNALLATTESSARRLIDHAFRLALVVVAVAIGGSLAAALVYRAVVRRGERRARSGELGAGS